MKTNLIKTELTLAQILNHQLNWGYQPNAKDLVYYNTDEEYFTFNRLQDEPMADTSMAEDTYIFDGVTFYIFKD